MSLNSILMNFNQKTYEALAYTHWIFTSLSKTEHVVIVLKSYNTLNQSQLVLNILTMF